MKNHFIFLNYTNKNILVSHSNLKKYRDHDRNLTFHQLIALKEANGLLGLTLVGGFISANEEEKTLNTFLLHLKEAIKIMGIDNICFGFDFMDYFDPPTTKNLNEVKSASEVSNFISFLSKSGFTNEEIEKMTYYNIYNRFKRHIVK